MASYFLFFILLLLFVLSLKRVLNKLVSFSSVPHLVRGLMYPIGFVVLCGLFSLAENSSPISSFLILFFYLVIPHIVMSFRGMSKMAGLICPAIAIASLALPWVDRTDDFSIFPSLIISNIDVFYPFGILNALVLFQIQYPLSWLGHTFKLNFRDMKNVLGGFVCLISILISIGLLMGFLVWNPSQDNFLGLCWGFFSMYFFIALPEELLFRGIIQNKFEQSSFLNKYGSWIITSILFGLWHVPTATPGFSAPNWNYGLLATISGFVYGLVWMRTRKITASAFVHAGIIFIWNFYLK